MYRSDLQAALAGLNDRSLPHFNQLVIWMLLASGALLACLPFTMHEGPRQGPASVLWWLPESLLSAGWLFWLFRGLLVAGGLLWLFSRGLPWSCWVMTAGFTGLWSMHVENTHNTAHIFNMANMLLVIQSLWITANAAEIRSAIAERRFWQTPLVPRWVSLASIAYIGLFHTAAGLSKLSHSGWGWASGTSLQLWTYLWGRPASPTTQMILASRTFTRWLQIGTIVIETSGILAIFPRLRPWIGLALVAFYIGVLATFDYGFQLNALFTAMYLLPLEAWMTRTATRRMASQTN